MAQKIFAIALAVGLLVGQPLSAASPEEQPFGKFKFRYQAYGASNACTDSAYKLRTPVLGEVEIFFSDKQLVAEGRQTGLHRYRLRLPLQYKPVNGTIWYHGPLQTKLILPPWPIKLEAVLSGTLTPSGFNLIVRYRAQGSDDCWSERYLRSSATIPPPRPPAQPSHSTTPLAST